MSMRSCRWFLPFFKSDMRFVYLFLFSKPFISLLPFFQFLHSVRLPLPFVSSRSFRYISFL
jgi:hypothetical protein